MDTPNTAATRTAQEVRAWFESHGVSVSEWAKTRGFPREIVYAVLSGRTKGHRGQAHQVAVALGIKAFPSPSGGSPLEVISSVRQ